MSGRRVIVGVLLVALGALVGCTIVPRTGGRPTPAATVGPTATATATPTVGPTSTATPAPTAGSFPVPTPAVPYRVTWYGDEFAGGPMRCTGEPYDPEDPTVAAAGAAGPPCGTRLRLCSESACIVVAVRDGCGGCGPRHLDLSRAGWDALGRPAEVVVTPLSSAEEAVAGGVLADLPVPDGLSVSTSGCARDGACYWYNFYWAATREVVLHGNDTSKLAHEMCHAHQHWTVNGGADLAPSDYDLESWYATAEAASYSGVATDWPWPYRVSVKANLLEDFAEACGLWYSDPGMLRRISPARYGWVAANLP